MTLKEAMKERHMVRKYTDRPLSEEAVTALNGRIAELNREHEIAMKLVTGNSDAFSAIIKLILAKGVKNYIILAGPDSSKLGEKLGYASAELMLYAQTLGLNTWWVGGTFNRGVSSQVSAENKVIGVVAIGYGVSQGAPHKSKSAKEVSSYKGDAPQWFTDGVEAALLAPTALNKQPFMISGDGNEVSISCDGGIFTGADLGLIKYHFELGAGKENFRWHHE
jgi:nitroreductase